MLFLFLAMTPEAVTALGAVAVAVVSALGVVVASWLHTVRRENRADHDRNFDQLMQLHGKIDALSDMVRDHLSDPHAHGTQQRVTVTSESGAVVEVTQAPPEQQPD